MRILFPYLSKPKYPQHHGHTREVNIMNSLPPLLSVCLVNLLHAALKYKSKEKRTSLIFPPQFYQSTDICIYPCTSLSHIINGVSLVLSKSHLPAYALNPILSQLNTPQSIPSLFCVTQFLFSIGLLLPKC